MSRQKKLEKKLKEIKNRGINIRYVDNGWIIKIDVTYSDSVALATYVFQSMCEMLHFIEQHFEYRNKTLDGDS